MSRLTTARIVALLPVAAGAGIIACVGYCAVWWTPSPMSITDLDSSFACWGYCATQSPFWGGLAVVLALGLIAAGVLFGRDPDRYARWLLPISLVTLPFGAAGLVPYFYHKGVLSKPQR